MGCFIVDPMLGIFQTTFQGWIYFFRYLSLSLGVAFFASGIVFFFAYNWDSLEPVYKFLIVQLSLLLFFGAYFVMRSKELVRKILLTGMSLLAGALWAVFGQIYQTGANTYEFFLIWLLSIGIWTLVSDFAPIWLLFQTLLNLCLFFYLSTYQSFGSISFHSLLFLLMNLPFLIGGLVFRHIFQFQVPNYFLNLTGLFCIFLVSVGVGLGIHDRGTESFALIFIISIFLYLFGFAFGVYNKNLMLVGGVPFSTLFIIISFLFKISQGVGIFYIVTILSVVSVFGIVKLISYVNNMEPSND